MSVVVVSAVLLGALVAAEVTIGRRRPGRPQGSLPMERSPGPSARAPDGAGRWDEPALGRAGSLVMLAGLGVLAVSLIVPFAENEGGCLDHCYDARQWYWWNPAHNLGAPLLLVGIVGLSTRLRSTPAPGCVIGAAAVCGWLGAVFTSFLAPAMADEFIYGGPHLEVLPTVWLAPVGWLLLWVGSIRLPRALGHVEPAP